MKFAIKELLKIPPHLKRVATLPCELEGARGIAYLRQVNFYRRPLFEQFLRGHVRTVPENMHVTFEVRSFNRFRLV